MASSLFRKQSLRGKGVGGVMLALLIFLGYVAVAIAILVFLGWLVTVVVSWFGFELAIWQGMVIYFLAHAIFSARK